MQINFLRKLYKFLAIVQKNKRHELSFCFAMKVTKSKVCFV